MNESSGKPLSLQERDAVQRNLFPMSSGAVLNRQDFPWHRNSNGLVTAATLPESSQALAIDVFGVLRALEDESRIVCACLEELGLPLSGPWSSDLEYLVDKELLGEPRPTQVDAILSSVSSEIFVECKFTESDGGSCSQVTPLRGPSANKGVVQCDGTYSPQVNPVTGIKSRCSLTGKGVRYWDHVPAVLGIPSDADHDPCPFRAGEYQWMRNLVACHAQSEDGGRRGAFLVVYAEGPLSPLGVIRPLGFRHKQASMMGTFSA